MRVMTIDGFKFRVDADLGTALESAAAYSEHVKRGVPLSPLWVWVRLREDPSRHIEVCVFDSDAQREAERSSTNRAKFLVDLWSEILPEESRPSHVSDLVICSGGVAKEIQLLEHTDRLAVFHEVCLKQGQGDRGLALIIEYVRGLRDRAGPRALSLWGRDRRVRDRFMHIGIFESHEALIRERESGLKTFARRLLPHTADPARFTLGTADIVLSSSAVLAEQGLEPSYVGAGLPPRADAPR